MKIFLTGGTGFVGKYVINKLKNEELLILNRSSKNILLESHKAQLLYGTLENINKWEDKVKKFNPDATIHLAWEGIPDYGIEQSLKNLNYGLNLYEFLSEINCKTILTTGSCWEYGGQQGKLSEDTPYKPFNAFTAAKHSLYTKGQGICRRKKIQFIWTRLFYVYGPSQRKESLIPYLINCAKNGHIPEIKNPNAKNDFIYVEDVAEAICQLISKTKISDDFNIGSGKLISIQDIIDIIFKIFKLNKKIKKAEAQHQDILSPFYANISKIEKAVGWKPKINIEEGIQKTIESIL